MRLVGEVQDEKRVLQQVGSEGRSFAAVTEADGDGRSEGPPLWSGERGGLEVGRTQIRIGHCPELAGGGNLATAPLALAKSGHIHGALRG